MCLFKTVEVRRPLLMSDTLMIPQKDFNKLGNDLYLEVISSDKRNEGISKSYFYFVVNKMRSIGLLVDNAVAFKIAFPFSVSHERLEIGEGIMFITEGRTLVYYNPEEDVYECGDCPVNSDCLRTFKSIVREVKVKVRNELLDEAWLSTIRELKLNLLSEMRYARVKVISPKETEEMETRLERPRLNEGECPRKPV